MTERITDRLRRRYIHAAARFRQRYDSPLPIEEYARLCELIAKGGGEGRRQNDAAKIEAWVESQGVWACAVFDEGEELIVSFMPVPPARLEGRDPRDVEITRLRAGIRRLEDENRRLRAERLAGGEPTAGSRRCALQAEESAARRRADIAWLKERMQDAKNLLRDGDVLGAVVLLDAVAGLKKSDHPGAEPERYAQVVAERAAQIRPHWEQLFAHLKGAA